MMHDLFDLDMGLIENNVHRGDDVFLHGFKLPEGYTIEEFANKLFNEGIRKNKESSILSTIALLPHHSEITDEVIRYRGRGKNRVILKTIKVKINDEIYDYSKSFTEQYINNKIDEYNEEFEKIILFNFKPKENVIYAKRKEIGKEFLENLKFKLFVRALTDPNKEIYYNYFQSKRRVLIIAESHYNIGDNIEYKNQKTQDNSTQKQVLKHKILKSLNSFWHKIQFWKPTKYQDLLGFRENNTRLYDIAFIHSSMSQRDKKGRLLNNERLEFLGDAVLETVMSEMLYKYYPNQKEGFLSSTRALFVRRKTTNELGEKMGLRKYVVMRKGNNNFNNITGNLFEALVGAVYLDKGYDVAADFILRSYKKHINMEKLLRKEQNYKSMLLEWSQKERKEFYYELIEETRIEDNKIRFQSRVIIDGKPMGYGVANSKRESEQAAAKQAIQTLKD